MITIYTQPHCGFCEVLKFHLEKHNIQYEECIETTVIQNNYVKMPKLKMEDDTVLGFTEALIWVKSQNNYNKGELCK